MTHSALPWRIEVYNEGGSGGEVSGVYASDADSFWDTPVCDNKAVMYLT